MQRLKTSLVTATDQLSCKLVVFCKPMPGLYAYIFYFLYFRAMLGSNTYLSFIFLTFRATLISAQRLKTSLATATDQPSCKLVEYLETILQY